MKNKRPRVALVHDVLAARAGGERLLLAFAQAFPDAPIHTLMHEPSATFHAFGQRTISTSWLDKSKWLRANYRIAAPVAGPTYVARKIDAPVTICSTSGLSHHVRTSGAKIVYCHTPARWLHDSDGYLQGYPTTAQLGVKLVAPAFRRLDRWAMRSADQVIANSTTVAHEIERIYGVEAKVLAPCSMLDLDGPVEPLPGLDPDAKGFVLSPARPLGYKRLDVLVDAARALSQLRFIHIGDGPHVSALALNAPANFTSFGAVTDAQLRWAYRNALVVALTCAEDFGLVPLEASAHGVHTVAPHARGLLDHDATMLTTYPFASTADLVAALESAPQPRRSLDPERLGVDRFIADMQTLVGAYR